MNDKFKNHSIEVSDKYSHNIINTSTTMNLAPEFSGSEKGAFAEILKGSKEMPTDETQPVATDPVQ